MCELTDKQYEKFHTSYGPVNGSSCLEWKRGKDKDGYGVFYANSTSYKAHRLAAALGGLEIGGLCVCHTCDNPACVRLDHLFVGTNGDNVKDRHQKGRSRNRPSPGESHNMAKLTNQQIREIRRSSERGVDLAKKFGVSQATISNVRGYKVWKHL